MKGLILAAGRGRRMGKITSNSHKCLVEVHGFKLLDLQISAMLKAGINEIGIVTGYNSHLLKKDSIIRYFHNENWANTNMVSSLSVAKDWLNKYNCVISYSDIFYSHTAIESLLKEESNISITYDMNWKSLWEKRFQDPLKDAESFSINKDSILLSIGKKEKNIEKIKGQFMGLIYFKPKGWHQFEKTLSEMSCKIQKKISITEVFDQIIFSGKETIKAAPYNKIWGEVDSKSDLEIYNYIIPRNDEIFQNIYK